MVAMSVMLSVAGLLATLICWVTYLATVPKGNVPVRPIGGIILAIVGSGAAAAGIAVRLKAGEAVGVAVGVPAGVALVLGLMFLFVLSQRKTPVGDIKVKVGDGLLPFASKTSAGVDFHSDSLAGQRVLLKFFRGSW